MYLSPCVFSEKRSASCWIFLSFDLVVTVFFGSSLNSTHSVELNYSFPVHRILYSVEVIGLASSWLSVKQGPAESLWWRRPTKVYKRLWLALACGASSSLVSLSPSLSLRL